MFVSIGVPRNLTILLSKSESFYYPFECTPEGTIITMMVPSLEEKWNSLATDYAVVSPWMAVVAISRFHDFRMRDGDTIVHT